MNENSVERDELNGSFETNSTLKTPQRFDEYKSKSKNEAVKQLELFRYEKILHVIHEFD